ncbi:hypothetical protein QQM79_20730 [Marinobacteraceae bacterium S3BR75-40.1]
MATPLPNTSDLPYFLPKDTQGQLRELAKILNISPALVANSGEKGLEAMTSTILYRHMDQLQRMKAMAAIRSVANPQFEQQLVTRAVDTTFVNPQWGLWSMTNAELAEDEAFHSLVEKIGGFMGFTFSVTGGKDFVTKLIQNRRLSKGGVATIVIWLAFAANSGSLNAVHAEQKRRMQTKGSAYYQ